MYSKGWEWKEGEKEKVWKQEEERGLGVSK